MQREVEVAVIVAREFHHGIAARERARDADRALHRFASGGHETQPFHRRHVRANALGERTRRDASTR